MGLFLGLELSRLGDQDNVHGTPPLHACPPRLLLSLLMMPRCVRGGGGERRWSVCSTSVWHARRRSESVIWKVQV